MSNVPAKFQITHKTSTEAIFELLNEAIKKPNLFISDFKFKTALKSQGGIAKLQGEWECSTHTIKKGPMTLNTLKKHSKVLLGDRFNDGWDIVNELRINAKDAIESELNKGSKPTKRTKTGLQEIIQEKEDSLIKQKAVNLILLQALSGAIQTIKTVSETPDKELRGERALRGLERLRAVISLNQPPYNRVETNGNIVSITGGETNEQ
ncbi:TPA: hypothetical protein ACX6RR_003536 [Photobacterium damselae]